MTSIEIRVRDLYEDLNVSEKRQQHFFELCGQRICDAHRPTGQAGRHHAGGVGAPVQTHRL